jgi:uncharacterized protein (TIGR03086 family)
MDLLDLYDRGSAWTAEKIKGAKEKLDASTRCEEWNVRDIVNHLLQGHAMFQRAARGEDMAPPPPGKPEDVLNGDAAQQFEQGRQATLDAFRGASEDKNRALGIAFADTLVHGSDIAHATGQDATMPPDLAEAALGMVSGIPKEGAPGMFKAHVDVPDDAPAHERLLGVTGRKP